MPVFLVWRTQPSICIGRHQNPWKECQLSVLEKEKVTLARRYSGGGAIFMDMGCTVYAFLNPVASASLDRNFDIVCKGVQRLGFDAKRTGRNDIHVDGKKISGNAFQQTGSHTAMHGTILVDTDMTALGRLLTPNKLKLQAKGISSIQQRVLNLKTEDPSITHDQVAESLIQSFLESYGAADVEIEDICEETFTNERFLQEKAQLEDWNWRFGRTPEFSHSVEFRIDGQGLFDVHLQVEKALIVKCCIFSDALIPEVVKEMQDTLVNVEYNADPVRAQLSALASRYEGAANSLVTTFCDELVKHINE